MKKETGGSAFPNSETDGNVSVTYGGMTLRDYFAAKAMAPLIEEKGVLEAVILSPDGFAASCYILADAMLAARSA